MTTDPDRRRRDLAKIHLAKKQLGLDDDTYRDMLWAVARVRSSADLDFTGLQRVLAHLQSRGFKSAPAKRADPDRPSNINSEDRGPSLRKIEAQLASAGRDWKYAHGIARRMFHVEHCQFCSVEQLGKIIAALNFDQARRGRRVG